MAGDLVSLGSDALHQPGRFLGDPAQHEEGAADLLLIQQAQDPAGIGLHAVLARRPRVARNGARQGRDLEIVLDVYRERVDRALRGRTWGAAQDCRSALR